MVTSTSEDGPGSLRTLVEQAVPGDTITFDPNIFPPQDPATIHFTQQNPISLMQGDITIEIFSGDESGMKYFEGSLQVQPDEQEN